MGTHEQVLLGMGWCWNWMELGWDGTELGELAWGQRMRKAWA